MDTCKKQLVYLSIFSARYASSHRILQQCEHLSEILYKLLLSKTKLPEIVSKLYLKQALQIHYKISNSFSLKMRLEINRILRFCFYFWSHSATVQQFIKKICSCFFDHEQPSAWNKTDEWMNEWMNWSVSILCTSVAPLRECSWKSDGNNEQVRRRGLGYLCCLLSFTFDSFRLMQLHFLQIVDCIICGSFVFTVN